MEQGEDRSVRKGGFMFLAHQGCGEVPLNETVKYGKFDFLAGRNNGLASRSHFCALTFISRHCSLVM